MLSNIYCAHDIELIFGTIKIDKNKSLTAVSYYRPPNKTDKAYMATTNKEISALRSQNKNNIFLVGGDFNLPDINWSDTSIEGSQYHLMVNQTILDMVVFNNLEQLVDFPTRKDKTLDLIFSSRPSYMVGCKPLPSIGNSDHDVILLDTSLHVRRPKPPKRKSRYHWYSRRLR